ncbi:MAG: RsmB/NOP family class I SAM-dependent RNA methyltransferase [Parcubacteria group bacterium]|nr:RsmB/NOP family class I SAM-dependent RNA methyltransferase [Parcubacteria group bacterium]
MRKHSLPTAFTDRLVNQFGRQGSESILASFKMTRATTFRVNTKKATDEDIMNFLRDHNIVYERVKTIPHAFIAKKLSSKEVLALPLCTDGHIYVQGLSSMVPPVILDPKPGETVLDLCAAPGSKTSQMANMMQGKGRLLAIEKDTVRFQKLQYTLNLQGSDFVEQIEGDALRVCKSLHGTFDAILADVPCSAEGRIDLNAPRSFHFWSERNIVAHAKLQRSLLRAAVPCLKPGGRLVYSTCTLAPEENEQMIDWLLTEFPKLKLLPVTSPLTGKPMKNGYCLLPNTKHEGLFVSSLKLR